MGTLLNRRRYMGGGSSLPYDAEIEYIESTGNQYINLPFGFDKTDEIYTSFNVPSNLKSDKYMICPITWNNNNNRFGMGNHTSMLTAAYGNRVTDNTHLYPGTNADNIIHDWQYKDYVFSVTDIVGIPSLDCTSITFGGTTANLRLFYGYNSNTKGKLRSYKHIKNGVVVVDLIAVRVGQVGYMYDKVSGELFGNDGTGSFILGQDIAKQMVEVEYIESNGRQYIDLPFGFDKTDEIYATFAVLTLSDEKYVVAPSRWNDNNNRFGFGIANSSYFGVGYGGWSTINTTMNQTSDTNIHDWQYKDYEFKITDIVNEPSIDVSSITFGGTTSNLKLFYGYDSNTSCRLKSYKHIKNGVTVIDLVAVRKGTKGYMYDRISGQLYDSATVSYFTYGQDVTT